MATTSASLYYCIKEARCKLCQFKVEDGEFVVAAIDDKRTSKPFKFVRKTSFDDELHHNLKFHMCCDRVCQFTDRQIACFHAACHEFKRIENSSKLLTVTEHSFQPTLLEEHQRMDRIVQLLSIRLKGVMVKKLPVEICQMIAWHLLRECAVICTHEMANNAEAAGKYTVDLSKDVYVRYVMVEGTRQIRSVRNISPTAPKLGDELLLRSKAHGLEAIYVGEGYLGVRQIHFSSCPTYSPDEPGLWWRKISNLHSKSRIKITTDGWKVRDIIYFQASSTAAEPRVLWRIKEPTATIMDLVKFESLSYKSADGLRMSFFDCNAAGTTGYSMATDGLRITTIQAHGEKLDPTLYNQVDAYFGRKMMWIYMPIDEGEYVTEIWKRAASRPYWPNVHGLIFTTNKRRTTLFGCWRQDQPRNNDFLNRIYTPTKEPSRIYFNEWDSTTDSDEVRYMAFDHIEEPEPRRYPASLNPITWKPYTIHNETWCYSFCRMEDVVKITLCANESVPHKPIIGMLLEYSNKSRTCLGQYRLDWASKTIDVTPFPNIYIAVEKSAMGFSYVTDVRVRAPLEYCSDITWLQVAWSGTFEWYFSSLQCRLFYQSGVAS